MKSFSEMTIALASDHAGFPLKQKVQLFLEDNGAKVKDFGCYSTESCDYPDFAHPCALAVENGECYPGIAVCGSGEGINITLNKHQGIRSALCWLPDLARLARQHNDANVLAMPGRFVTNEEAIEMVDFALSGVHGGCAKDNIASARTMEKGGMVQYGTEDNGDPLFRFSIKK